MTNVAVFGIGYVGSITAACLARDGARVVGVDVDAAKVAELNEGIPPVEEPGLTDLVERLVPAGVLSATTDVELAVRQSSVAMLAVGTPSGEDGSVCSRAVEEAVRAIGRALRNRRDPYTVVVRSTLLPGILEDRLTPILEDAAGRPLGADLWICNNPEFLREGCGIADYDNPPFVLLGVTDSRPAVTVLDLYDRVPAEQIVTDTRTAALVKYACNAFHATKVAFSNEIGSIARSFGANGDEVMRLLCRDIKLNISPAYLRPGFAFGGSCLPKDLRALIRHSELAALHTPLLPAVVQSNQDHIERAVRMVRRSGHRKIGLVGLGFKAATDDLRESPLVLLVETLLGRGLDIRIYDPRVSLSRLRGKNQAYVERHLPHLASLLVDDVHELYAHSSLLVLGSATADGIDWRTHYHGEVLDLRHDLVAPRLCPPKQAEAIDPSSLATTST